MAEQLVALFEQREIGRIIRSSGRLSFHYNETWRSSEESLPLSLSMRLTATEHSHAIIEAFLWGLLPDNEQVLDRWASRFHTSARNPFALISHVGEDCAGAIQFVRPERVQKLRTETQESEIEWLTEDQVGERLRILREDHSAWRLQSDAGQFSLAGAQPKTAFLFRNGRWGIPSGRTPSTHILKPPTGTWDGHAENEHFCLELAASLGLIASKSSVKRFGEEVAIVIERYDRYTKDSRILRRHQEDFCQTLGIPPTRKYQNDGGPSIREIVEVLRLESSRPADDVARFLDAVILNWLIAGSDAHAKNYAVLIGFERSVRLAPLYDVASILPYPKIQIQKVKMAMKIGGEYRLRMIGIRQWRKLAKEVRVDEDELVQRLRTLAAGIPDHTSKLRQEVRERGLNHPLIDRLAEAVTKRARSCADLLAM
jgi:serine/threonine-protein kinase HipA